MFIVLTIEMIDEKVVAYMGSKRNREESHKPKKFYGVLMKIFSDY